MLDEQLFPVQSLTSGSRDKDCKVVTPLAIAYLVTTDVPTSVHVKPSKVLPALSFQPPTGCAGLRFGSARPEVPATVTCCIWAAGSVICAPPAYAVFGAHGPGQFSRHADAPSSVHVTWLSATVPPLVLQDG